MRPPSTMKVAYAADAVSASSRPTVSARSPMPTRSTSPTSPHPVASTQVRARCRVRTTWNRPVSSGVIPIATSVPVATPTRVTADRNDTWNTA